jgi:hypothetical protein
MNDCYSWESMCVPPVDPCSTGGGCPATVDWFWWMAAAAAAVVILARSK